MRSISATECAHEGGEGPKEGLANHADRVDSVPFIGHCVAFAKEHVAQVRAAVAAQGLESRALGSAEDMAFFARPEACSDG